MPSQSASDNQMLSQTEIDQLLQTIQPGNDFDLAADKDRHALAAIKKKVSRDVHYMGLRLDFAITNGDALDVSNAKAARHLAAHKLWRLNRGFITDVDYKSWLKRNIAFDYGVQRYIYVGRDSYY